MSEIFGGGIDSVCGTKLPGYIWPAYPAAAGLAAAFWHAWSRAEARHDRWMPLAWCSLITAGIAFAIGGPLFISRSLPTESEAAIGWFLAAGVLTASGGLLTWLMQLERFALRRQWIPATLAVIGLVGSLVTAGLDVSARDALIGLFAGSALLAIPGAFFNHAARVVPAPETALLLMGEVILAPVWVWLFVDEQPELTTLVGGSIIFAAVFGLLLWRRQQAVAEPS